MRSRPIRDDSSVSCNDGTGDDECYSSYTKLVLAHTRHVLVSARPVSIDSGAGPHICLLFAEKGTDPTAKMLLSR